MRALTKNHILMHHEGSNSHERSHPPSFHSQRERGLDGEADEGRRNGSPIDCIPPVASLNPPATESDLA
jgi:hypothetical protein